VADRRHKSLTFAAVCATRVTADISCVAPDTAMPTHRFNYASDPAKGGTWFSDRGLRICDWLGDGEKKILTVWLAPSRKPVSLSGVDVERLEPQELGKRLSQIALEATQRVHRGH
jgi:hypothetical protein